MQKPHKQLRAWQLAMDLAQTVYQTTNTFPADERFGLTSQMRRCAVSIASNIAEGAGRQTPKEFIQFLHIAQGSLSELDTQLELAHKFGYLAQESWQTIDAMLEEEDKILSGLIRAKKATVKALSPNA